MDLAPTVAAGFFVTGARTLDDGSVRLAAMRFGTTGEVHRALVPAGATSLEGLAYARRDPNGTCLMADGAFALARYPYGDMLINGAGEVGGYNRYNEPSPYFRIAPGGAVSCRGSGEFSPATLVAGGGRTFAYWDDNPSSASLTVWDRPGSASSFPAGVGLSLEADASMDSVGIESGSHRERSILVSSAPAGVVVVPLDCTTDAPSSECTRGAAPSTYRAAAGVAVSRPLVRRLNTRAALVMWLEDRGSGARPPNNRVQELVTHVVDRDGAMSYAMAGVPGPGLPVLRYELDDSTADYRLARMVDAAVVRDPATGDLTIYSAAIYSRWVSTTLERPSASEVRLGGVRVCATP